MFSLIFVRAFIGVSALSAIAHVEREEEEKKGNCKLTYLDMMMTEKEKCFIIRVIILLLFVLWWSVCT